MFQLLYQANFRPANASRKNMTEISRLLNERRQLLSEIRALTPDEQAKMDALTAQVADIDARVMLLEEAAGAEPAPEAVRAGSNRMVRDIPLEHRAMNNAPTDSDILRSWARSGTPAERSDDREKLAKRGFSSNPAALTFRAQSTSGSAGGFTVPTGFLAEVSSTLKAVAPIRNLARVITTASGETLKIPACDDTSNTGAIVAENVAYAEQDLAFTEISMGSHKYTSKMVRVSNELIEDSGIDLGSFLAAQLGERIGRAQEAHFLTGTGSGQPQGVITAATTVNAGSATAIAVSDLFNLIKDIDPAFIGNNQSVAWMMNPQVFYTIRKLLDSTGRPLLGDVGNGAEMNLLGYPVVLTSGMDSTIVATKKSVLFGAFNQYLIRDVSDIVVARSVDRYFELNQTAFVAYQRTDAKALQAGAFRVLLH
jgi:HK97 family phage major capsid protein